MKKSIYIPNNKGFTLVETLVAIFVLTTAIAAALTAASSGLQASYFARDQITAYYLAEEAVEFIRNARDTNFINQVDWLENIPVGCFVSETNTDIPPCRIDVPANTIDVALSPDDLQLWFSPNIADPSGGYTYADLSDLEQSKYTREISIVKRGADLTNPSEIFITVTMKWRSGAVGQKSLVLHESLFDWQSQGI